MLLEGLLLSIFVIWSAGADRQDGNNFFADFDEVAALYNRQIKQQIEQNKGSNNQTYGTRLKQPREERVKKPTISTESTPGTVSELILRNKKDSSNRRHKYENSHMNSGINSSTDSKNALLTLKDAALVEVHKLIDMPMNDEGYSNNYRDRSRISYSSNEQSQSSLEQNPQFVGEKLRPSSHFENHENFRHREDRSSRERNESFNARLRPIESHRMDPKTESEERFIDSSKHRQGNSNEESSNAQAVRDNAQYQRQVGSMESELVGRKHRKKMYLAEKHPSSDFRHQRLNITSENHERPIQNSRKAIEKSNQKTHERLDNGHNRRLHESHYKHVRASEDIIPQYQEHQRNLEDRAQVEEERRHDGSYLIQGERRLSSQGNYEHQENMNNERNHRGNHRYQNSDENHRQVHTLSGPARGNNELPKNLKDDGEIRSHPRFKDRMYRKENEREKRIGTGSTYHQHAPVNSGEERTYTSSEVTQREGIPESEFISHSRDRKKYASAEINHERTQEFPIKKEHGQRERLTHINSDEAQGRSFDSEVVTNSNNWREYTTSERPHLTSEEDKEKFGEKSYDRKHAFHEIRSQTSEEAHGRDDHDDWKTGSRTDFNHNLNKPRSEQYQTGIQESKRFHKNKDNPEYFTESPDFHEHQSHLRVPMAHYTQSGYTERRQNDPMNSNKRTEMRGNDKEFPGHLVNEIQNMSPGTNRELNRDDELQNFHGNRFHPPQQPIRHDNRNSHLKTSSRESIADMDHQGYREELNINPKDTFLADKKSNTVTSGMADQRKILPSYPVNNGRPSLGSEETFLTDKEDLLQNIIPGRPPNNPTKNEEVEDTFLTDKDDPFLQAKQSNRTNIQEQPLSRTEDTFLTDRDSLDVQRLKNKYEQSIRKSSNNRENLRFQTGTENTFLTDQEDSNYFPKPVEEARRPVSERFPGKSEETFLTDAEDPPGLFSKPNEGNSYKTKPIPSFNEDFLTDSEPLPPKKPGYRIIQNVVVSSEENTVDNNFLTDNDPNPVLPAKRERITPLSSKNNRWQSRRNHKSKDDSNVNRKELNGNTPRVLSNPLFYEDIKVPKNDVNFKSNNKNMKSQRKQSQDRSEEEESHEGSSQDNGNHPSEEVGADQSQEEEISEDNPSEEHEDSDDQNEHNSGEVQETDEQQSEENTHGGSNEESEESPQGPTDESEESPPEPTDESEESPPEETEESPPEESEESPAEELEESPPEKSEESPLEPSGELEESPPEPSEELPPEPSEELVESPPEESEESPPEESEESPPGESEESPPAPIDASEETPSASQENSEDYEDQPPTNEVEYEGENTSESGDEQPPSDSNEEKQPVPFSDYDERPPDYDSFKPTPEYEDSKSPAHSSEHAESHEYTDYQEGNSKSNEEQVYPVSPKPVPDYEDNKLKPNGEEETILPSSEKPPKEDEEDVKNFSFPELNFESFEFDDIPKLSSPTQATTTKGPTSHPNGSPEYDGIFSTLYPMDFLKAKKPIKTVTPERRPGDEVTPTPFQPIRVVDIPSRPFRYPNLPKPKPVSITVPNPTPIRVRTTKGPLTTTSKPVTISALGVVNPGNAIIAKVVQPTLTTAATTAANPEQVETPRKLTRRPGRFFGGTTKRGSTRNGSSTTTKPTGGSSLTTTKSDAWKSVLAAMDATALTYLKPPPIGQGQTWFQTPQPPSMFKLFVA